MVHDRPSLPKEPADRLTRPFVHFLQIEAASGLLLLTAAVAALMLANSPWSTPFLEFWEIPIGLHFGTLDFSRSLRHWINDALMTLFFFVVALELKRELVLGELQNRSTAALPFVGALGGMIVPVFLYLALMGGQPGAHGWGTVMATDTAFVIGCLALFGSRIPASLRLFLLSLAIFDDIGAILVVAVGYGDHLNWNAIFLALIGFGAVAGAARVGIRSIPIYFLLGGVVWLCVDASGIHATIAGVVLGLMTPTHAWVSDARLRRNLERLLSYPGGEHWSGDTPGRRDLRRVGVAVTESLSPVERLEIMLHPWAGFVIMPIFALANAGVPVSLTDIGQPVFVAIFVGLVIGKPVGVIGFSWLAVQLHITSRPTELSWSFLAAGGFLTGIGFTMSLFIAGLAYSPSMLDIAKVGILTGSIFSAAVGLIALSWLTLRRRR
nr:Na+/H+ antiporter NhaA [Nitrosomonas nitrosa]